MGNINIKQRCPKCGGNLFLYKDLYGWYEQCLQCSYTLSMNVVYKHGVKVGLEFSAASPEVTPD